MIKKLCGAFFILVALMMSMVSSSYANELLLNSKKIIAASAGQIPQAPRVSPDGNQLLFEYYDKEKVSLWYATTEGGNAHCLTCEGTAGQATMGREGMAFFNNLSGMKLENGSWHPSGNYIIFNKVPDFNLTYEQLKTAIFVAAIKDGTIEKPVLISNGARPQFSHPNGHVIFFEAYQRQEDGSYNNMLAYQILGKDPTHPLFGMSTELRGPIQRVNKNAEISHPSLAPDGTTIVFAARTNSFMSYGSEQRGVVLNDTDRQKIYKLWKILIATDKNKINKELATFAQAIEKYYGGSDDDDGGGGPFVPAIGNQDSFPRSEFELLMNNEAEYMVQQTFVPGYTKKQILLAWMLGLLDMLDNRYDAKIQEMIYSRLWTTDVFGAPIVPLVKDLASAPLPQKWPTVSHDGKFVVFEAGHYTDRHIYLIAKKGGQWMDKAIKITGLGTYNSSPEIDPSGQWLYFESNRDGSKGIWRAKLNWPEINKRLGL